MTSQSTRLELTIVAAVLLVLFLCRQPPQPGTAGVRTNMGQSTSDEGQGTGQSPAGYGPSALGLPQSPIFPPAAANPSGGRTTPDNATMDLTAPPRPKTKQIWMVDARNCPGLNYKEVMYGELTARWVWDGGRFVLRKVIEVREANGSVSTWDLAEPNGAIFTALDP